MKLNIKQLRRLIREEIEKVGYSQTMENKTVEVEYNGHGEIVGLAYLDPSGRISKSVDIEQHPGEEDEISGAEAILYVHNQLVDALQTAQNQGVKTVVDSENPEGDTPIGAYIQQCKEYIQEVQENPENYDW